MSPTQRLRVGGGYRGLHCFQTATVIYDATVAFCDRFIDKRSRTHDQMVQAARSGRQNIAEGSRASTSSSQTEIRLVGVARASLDELLLDFEDYLRQHGALKWPPHNPEALAVRAQGSAMAQIIDRTDRTDRTDQSDKVHAAVRALYAPWLDSPDPVVQANAVICLIHQANFLLDKLLAALEHDFIESGGYTERLAKARIAHSTADPANPAPSCPRCGLPMALRTANKGNHAGVNFWGCSGYPKCKGLVPIS